MPSVQDLRRLAEEGLAYLKAQPDVAEAEVFVSANTALFARLNYTSHIPCNGVEEPKSVESLGVGVRVAFRTPEGLKVGFGAEPADLTLRGVRRALEKARRSAVPDPEFVSLPRPTGEPRLLRNYHDPALMGVEDEGLAGLGWTPLEGALEAFASSEDLLARAGSPERLRDLGLIVGGDVTLLKEQVAIASTGLPQVETDESTILMCYLTAMVEGANSKGGGWSVHARLADFSPEPGRECARNAIRAMGGVRVPEGEYPVIFGPHAVAELLTHLVIPSLRADVFYARASAFQGKLGKVVASDRLLLYDHGALAGFAGSKGVTDEGLPTGRTDLIRHGELVGLLTDHYNAQRLLRDPHAREKLGVDPQGWAHALVPRNGFRFARGGGRQFDRPPGIFGTNVVVDSWEKCTREDLLRRVGNGLYIGRIWYTYPINGLPAGDFTCTVVGDAYVVRDGRLAEPVKPNTLRINDNIRRVLEGVIGVGGPVRGTLVWAGDQVIYTPEVAVARVEVREIARYMEQVYPAQG